MKDLHGDLLSGFTIDWASDDETLGTVDSYGLARGIAEGLATITASAGPASGSGISYRLN